MEQHQPDGGWDWPGRYLAVIVLSLILAAAIGNMELFSKTTISGKLNASHIVQFLGYGAALAAFWMLARRATIELRRQTGRWSAMQHLILPAVSLVVVSFSYSVLLLLLRPVMNATLQNIYNWVFVLGILACAGWLVMAVFNQSAVLTELLTDAAGKSRHARRVCGACGATCGPEAKFCDQCGKAL
jgi:hypothetical protein